MARRKRVQEARPRFVRKLNTIGTHHRIVKNIGSIVLLKAMAERMGIRTMVDARIPMQREVGLTHGQIVETLVINRCHAPRPLYEMEDWAHRSGISDLHGVSHELFNDDRIRSTLDLLPEYEADFQSDMALRMIDEFDVPVREVLYDITSLYFEGDYSESELVEYGYSRDSKPDKKQVNLALTTTRDGGVPVQAHTLPGGTADPTTVEKNAQSLRRTLSQTTFLQITDGGMLTPATVHFMEQEGLEFVAPWRADTDILNSLEPDKLVWQEVPYQAANAKNQSRYWVTELGVKIIYNEELTNEPPPERQPGQRGRLPKHPKQHHVYWERAIIVRSSSKEARDEKSRTKHINKINEGLEKVKNGLNRYRLKRRTQVESRLDRLFSGYLARYRACIDLTLEGPDEQMAFTWSWDQGALERLAQRDGIYILLTNRRDTEQYPADDILLAYKERNRVEQRIRDLKSTVKIRPLFVHTDTRIQALVWVTVVSLQLYSLIEWEAKKAQYEWTARFLERAFNEVSVLQSLREDGTIEMEWCNIMPHHMRVLEILGLPLIELPDRLEPFG